MLSLSSITSSLQSLATHQTGPSASPHHESSASSSFSLWGNDGFSFRDILDVINPLQHLPVVSGIYRKLSEDEQEAIQFASSSVQATSFSQAEKKSQLPHVALPKLPEHIGFRERAERHFRLLAAHEAYNRSQFLLAASDAKQIDAEL